MTVFAITLRTYTDIDECRVSNECQFNQICVNNIGGYSCTCPRGYRSNGPNSPCVGKFDSQLTNSRYRSDIVVYLSNSYISWFLRSLVFVYVSLYAIKWTQLCSTLKCDMLIMCQHFWITCEWSFWNTCDLDIDECASTPSPCSYSCQNTRGGYHCLCPPGQKLLADRKSCAGSKMFTLFLIYACMNAWACAWLHFQRIGRVPAGTQTYSGSWGLCMLLTLL